MTNLKALLRDFYSDTDIGLSSIARREVAFEAWNGYFNRDNQFNDAETLTSVLQIRTPKAVFASNAHYLDAAHPDKKKKEIKGVDLAFDFDFTDLPEHDKGEDFWENIEAIRLHVVRLIEVVLPRLGISKEHVSVSFSGSKGYHVRVLTPATFKLTRDQRRQIQEFVAGHSLMDFYVMTPVRSKSGHYKAGWSEKEHGWPGYISQAAKDYLGAIFEADMATATKFVTANLPCYDSGEKKGQKKKATDKSVTEIVSLIKDNPDFLKGGRFDSVFKKKNQRTLVVDSIRQFAKTNNACAIDLSVTQDMRRILRVPGTIHGKTGIPCMPLDIEDLGIEVIQDKHKEMVGEDEIEINLSVPVNTVYGAFDKGTHILPRYLALCALCAEANE